MTIFSLAPLSSPWVSNAQAFRMLMHLTPMVNYYYDQGAY